MTRFIPLHVLKPEDEVIAASLDHIQAPLIAALALATGDRDLLRDDLRPDLSNFFDPEGGWTAEQREIAAELARDALIKLRDMDPRDVADPDPGPIKSIIEFLIGQAVGDDMLAMMLEELGLEGVDLRAPGWTKTDVAPERDFTVAVIGAGLSGLLAAHRLNEAGVPFVVLEKNPEVGGTWFENRYPGCRVDVASHFFSYSCAQKHDWPRQFSSQDVLLDYFKEFANDNNLRDHIRFGTAVSRAAWSEDSSEWVLEVQGPDGPGQVKAHAIVIAVGQLNRPQLPDIDGLDTFEGPWFHSACWDQTVDMEGKKVAVLGTGCSAAQLIPEIAKVAGQLTIFQRTPPWFAPTPEYHDDVSPGQRWLLEHVPFYSQWYRFWLFYHFAEALLPYAKVDPDWPDKSRSVSEANEMLRLGLEDYIKGQFADRPDLLPKVLPTYPPASKRIVRDNGIWAQTLKRDDVELVTERIERIAPEGVRTDGGVLHEADVIVYATGFTASDFLVPMTIVGRDGIELQAQWGGDARAYLGMTVPHFPNMFCLYGPNTNLVVNGSVIFMTECELRYIMGCLRYLLEQGGGSMEPRQAVHDEFNARIDAENRRSVWGVATVNSWYRNKHGRTAQNWPFGLLDYWAATRQLDPADFVVHDPAGLSVTP